MTTQATTTIRHVWFWVLATQGTETVRFLMVTQDTKIRLNMTTQGTENVHFLVVTHDTKLRLNMTTQGTARTFPHGHTRY